MMKLRTVIESGRIPGQRDDPEIRKIARHFSKNLDVSFERIAPGRAALANRGSGQPWGALFRCRRRQPEAVEMKRKICVALPDAIVITTDEGNDLWFRRGAAGDPSATGIKFAEFAGKVRRVSPNRLFS
jgi:hypothetical protein